MSEEKIQRMRKKNWSEDEMNVLLDHMEEHYEKLVGKFSSKLSANDKKHTWKKIADDLHDRDVEEIKRKFFNIKSEKIRNYASWKKGVNATGMCNVCAK